MKKTVLIIDDSKMVHRLVEAWLREEAVDFVFAEDGKSGMAFAATVQPDLILLDVDMPRQNGFEICRLLKADRATANIPVIFLTAVTDVHEKINGLGLGADDYITKPFNPGELRARVKAALRGVKIEPGVAHLAGLCYDLCDIVLRQHFAAEYEAMSKIIVRTGRPSWQVRSAVFGMPYHELVTLVLGKLDLPQVIITPIAQAFARSTTRDEEQSGGPLARALRIANIYAHGLMLAAGADAPIVPIGRAEYRSTFGDTPVPDLDPSMLRSEVLTTVNLLAGVGSAEAAELCRPPIRSAARKLLYWRHAGYCELDPLGTLLGFAADVDTVTSPPDTVAGYDVLIVAGPRQETAAQQQLAATTQLDLGTIPALYLSGLAPQQATAPARILCRQLPLALCEAATILNGIKPERALAA